MMDYLFSPSTINLSGWVFHVPLIAHWTYHGFLLCFAGAGLSALRAGQLLK